MTIHLSWLATERLLVPTRTAPVAPYNNYSARAGLQRFRFIIANRPAGVYYARDLVIALTRLLYSMS